MPGELTIKRPILVIRKYTKPNSNIKGAFFVEYKYEHINASKIIKPEGCNEISFIPHPTLRGEKYFEAYFDNILPIVERITFLNTDPLLTITSDFKIVYKTA
ncbi:MAG: hypothetical protein WCQ95_01515 [Bacteroidota bacterium]